MLGCAVNGPGESGDADFGIAGGRDVGFIYAHGKVLRKVDSEVLVDELFHEIDRWIAEGMRRPERAQDGQAGGARDGRGLGDPARIAWPGSDADRPRLSALPADAPGRAGRRRGDQPPAARPRPASSASSAAGLWTFTPLGWRVHRKVEQIIREEMDAIGAQEWLAPVLTPVELWQATGRDRIPEIFKLSDRAGRRFVLPMTHEETFTFHARELQQLPLDCRRPGTTSRPRSATSRVRAAG